MHTITLRLYGYTDYMFCDLAYLLTLAAVRVYGKEISIEAEPIDVKDELKVEITGVGRSYKDRQYKRFLSSLFENIPIEYQ